MLSKLKRSSFMVALLVTCVLLQLLSQALGFSSMRGTRDDVAHLTTRMARGVSEPADIVGHAKEKLAPADSDFSSFVSQASTNESSHRKSASLQQQFRTLRQALGELTNFLDANNLQAYLDQPTQKYQDAFLLEQHRYAEFVALEAGASLDSVDRR